MRATDGLQTTITLGSVNPNGQVFSLGWRKLRFARRSFRLQD